MKALLLIFLAFTFSSARTQQTGFTIVFLNKNENAKQLSREESKKIMDGHLANQERLWKEGKLLASGPFEGGGGMFVMSSSSAEQVKEWISSDPGIIAERWIIEILPYHPRYGGICPVGENYEMTNYSFVRFDALVSKFTAGNFPALMNEHDQFLKKIIDTGNVITEAIFGPNEGGILVLRGEIDPDLFDADPAAKAGLVQSVQKKLFIAKGSFCEQ